MSRMVLVLNVAVLLVTTLVAFQTVGVGDEQMRVHSRMLELPTEYRTHVEPVGRGDQPCRGPETSNTSKARFLSYANSLPEVGTLTPTQMAAIDRALTICCTSLAQDYDGIRDGAPGATDLRTRVDQIFSALRARIAGMLADVGIAETALREKLVEVVIACAS